MSSFLFLPYSTGQQTIRVPKAFIQYVSACLLVFPLFFWPRITRIETLDPNTLMYLAVWLSYLLYAGYCLGRYLVRCTRYGKGHGWGKGQEQGKEYGRGQANEQGKGQDTAEKAWLKCEPNVIESTKEREGEPASEPRFTSTNLTPLDWSVFEEALIALAGIGFLFSYIFAANANLDYVQWFIQSGGNLKLSPDSGKERLVVFLRYAPLLVISLVRYGISLRQGISTWRLGKVIFSSLLTALAFPSFLILKGMGLLAWISLVPLCTVLFQSGRRGIVFYGTVYGVFASTLVNFWLGTFSLVSLQVVMLIQGGFYFFFFMAIAPLFERVAKPYRFILFPTLFTCFEYLRSSGFLGYPWGLWGASQYAFPAILQIASVTGVWGVSFAVLIVNATIAELFLGAEPFFDERREAGELGTGKVFSPWTLRDNTSIQRWLSDKVYIPNTEKVRAFLFTAFVFLFFVLFGLKELNSPAARVFSPSVSIQDFPTSSNNSLKSVTLALVQQNTDPRKDQYQKTFEILRSLTDAALKENTPIDLVVWSETAFVPNIRRWSQEDPQKYELARLVQELLTYQKSMGTYLVTGNDDYEVISYGKAVEERKNYNAAVFFDSKGAITDVYHKNKLVPFTEYFPYEKEFPWIYQALLAFDVHFWEPGTKLTVFQHPKFRFATPICFEDVFPYLVRDFVLRGTEIIVNLSNDYWSLTPVEGMQHGTHALLRAVENRRPLLRATASGLTLYADPYGRIHATLPQYKEGVLVGEVPLLERWEQTLYTRWGDWFPLFCGLVAVLLMMLSLKDKGRVAPSPGRGEA
ncbi:MAG: apolipoprotein N-acyltransferase [Spirochaetales bacterium]